MLVRQSQQVQRNPEDFEPQYHPGGRLSFKVDDDITRWVISLGKCTARRACIDFLELLGFINTFGEY
jgi:hypothetical protein